MGFAERRHATELVLNVYTRYSEETVTQSNAILEHLRSGKTITPLEAFALYGTLALHSRAAELRKAGYKIECKIVAHGKTRFGEYKLLP